MPEASPRPLDTARSVLARTELDPRLAGMFVALALIWIAFDQATGGLFLTSRNLYNLAVQSSVVGIMATGMTLVIVARHIDLSVGSLLGLTGMAIATLQAEVLPAEARWGWPLALALGLLLGCAIGAIQGYWVAYRGLPAFVVSLAGLLIWRGCAYLLTDGRTVAPLDPDFVRLGGGLSGSIGATASSVSGLVAAGWIVVAGWRDGRARRTHGFAPRPLWARVAVVGLWWLAIAAFVAVMNSHTQPRTGVSRGIPIPVLVLLGVTLAVTALARRTRFGRYVFAIGGSPRAALRAGIDVPRVTVALFGLMGLLCGVAGAVTTARLGAGTSSMGTLAELSVIAAAVIGGTRLAGGVGSVPGALLGATLMQSLENGLVLLGASSALRQISIGVILLAAVWLDTVLTRRSRGS